MEAIQVFVFCLTFLGQSGKRQSGKQDNPTNTKENPADRKIRQTLVKDNPANKTIWGVWSFPTCLFVGFSFINVCRIVQFAGFSCMKIRQIDLNYTRHPSNTFSLAQILSYVFQQNITGTTHAGRGQRFTAARFHTHIEGSDE